MSAPRPTPSRLRARKILLVFAATLALVGGVLVAPAGASAAPAPQTANTVDQALGSPVKTADLSQFRPGNIISDQVFYNRSTMTEAQVQWFLESKVPSCQSGYTCLKDWYDTSRSTGADPMCGAYSGGYRERASAIIYKVAQACGINPQAIITTLQKEQGLVTNTGPSTSRYTIAMGQGCPDTAACDTRYYGFFNQVYGAAWQLKRYGNPPGTSNYFNWYAPGRTWNVRFHPNAACGSTPVYIENQATAALYYYTPYQPNAAALAAGYAAANNPCSSYGNRNFFNYFNDWFGSTQGETMQVLQVSGTSERYLVSQGARWRLATAEIAAQFTWISGVRDVSRSALDAFADRGAAKRAVRTETGNVYLLDGGARMRLRDVYQVSDFGWDYGALPLASEAQVARYRDAGWLERAVSADGATWLVQSNARRQLIDLGILPRYGIPALSSSISPAMMAEYTTAAPVVGPGVYRDATNPYRLQTDAGTYVVPDAASGTAIARSARALTAESFAFLRASSSMPVRMTSGGKSYVMVDGGWLEVSASQYPPGLEFTSLPAGAAAGLPVVGSVSGPHFVRERSDSQVYLVSWGTMQAVSAADQAWVTGRYGVSSQVWPALDGAIGDGANPEGLVRTSSGAAYLLDGARAYRFRDCGQVSTWGGDCATLPTVTAAKLATYASAGTLQHLVRTPVGTIWLPQSGQMRQVLDPSILGVYGIPSSTSAVGAATVAKLPVGEPAIAPGVYTDGGSARAVATEGGEYTLTAEQSVGVMRTTGRALTAASYAKITLDGALPSRMRSDGRSFVLTHEGWLEVSAAAYGGDGVFTQLPSRAWRGLAVAANEQRPHFVRDEVNAVEYLVSGGAAQPVAGATERAAITARYGVPAKLWSMPGSALTGIRISYDLLVKGTSGEVFLMDGTTRYRTSGCGAAADFGKDCATLRTLTPTQLAGTTDGGALAALLRSADGYVFLPQSGKKREVPDPRVLSVYGIGTASTPISAQVLAQLPLGQPVVTVGVYDDRAGDVRVITGDGRTFSIPASSRIGAVTSAAWRISPASIDLLSAERDIPTRITAGARSYVLTNEGWLAVNASDYAPLAFASVGARASEGIPSAGTETRPHFARENTASQLHLVSAGVSTVADEATRAWISTTYGVPPKVWVLADGTLR